MPQITAQMQAQKQVTRQGAQCKAEALSEAWRVLLVLQLVVGCNQINTEPYTDIKNFTLSPQAAER